LPGIYLGWRPPRGLKSLGGVGSFIFAMILLAMAIPMLLAFNGSIPVAPKAQELASLPLLPFVASILIACAWGKIVHGLSCVKRRRGHLKGLRAGPESPWVADYPWNHDNDSGCSHERIRRSFKGARLLVMPLVAGSIVLGTFYPYGLLFFIPLGFSIPALCFIFATRSSTKRKKMGNPVLIYEEFPYFLGGEVHAQVVLEGGVGFETGSLKMTARAVQEKVMFVKRPRNKSVQVVACFELYSQEVTPTVSDGNRSASVSFVLPEDALETHLIDFTEPRYWELDVSARVNRLDFQERFLLPVYRRPENQ
jgi:hypothetical protein